MDKKFAVFVDGENISAKDYVPTIREIATYGEILMKRVYGDWTTTSMNTWKDILIKEPATPCQQFRSGKNAADTRIIMDAIEMMLQNTNVNAFCIVSTDADFFGLVQRLRENGKYVLGVGKEHSKPILQEACDKFVKLESLYCEETGILLEKPRHFGLIEHERGIFHFPCAEINGDIKEMKEGVQVKFKVFKEPDPMQVEKRNQRGKATDIRLVG